MDTPGIHTGSYDQYVLAGGLRQTMLKELSHPRTPAHFRAKYIDKIVEDKETPAKKLGTLTHRLILEPDTIEGAFHIRPEGMKFTTKDGMAWRDSHQDRPIITSDESSAIYGMRESVLAHPIARKFLERSLREQNVFADDDGIRLKARLDLLPDSGNALADLKTCEDACDIEFSKSIDNFGYYFQAAFYLDLCKLAGREFTSWVFIAVEKHPPYLCATYNLEPIVIDYGRKLYRRDLHVYRDCIASGKWPGYAPNLTCISLPPYRQKELENA